MASKKKARPVTKSGRPRARKGVKLRPTELGAPDLVIATDQVPAAVTALVEQVKADGGAVLAIYKEPLGGHVQLLVALPIERVEPTPFQRDVSDAHVRKLTVAMDRTRRYLDPIIAVRKDGKYLTPNGGHRLTALKELGAKSIVALLVPEAEVAYQILALNIEKAHNLRERALEVVRMYDELATVAGERPESDFAGEFEEPSLTTLGFAYVERGRLAGGAYHPLLRKTDAFYSLPIGEARPLRKKRAQALLALDDAVNDAVEKLKARGMVSPYLKTFVVARINPLRFIKGAPPPVDEFLESVTKRARGLKVDGLRIEDLARSGGAPDSE